MSGSWEGFVGWEERVFVLGKETSLKVLGTCNTGEIYNRHLEDSHESVRREAYILRKEASSWESIVSKGGSGCTIGN